MVAPEDEKVHANYSGAKQVYELIQSPKQWQDIVVKLTFLSGYYSYTPTAN